MDRSNPRLFVISNRETRATNGEWTQQLHNVTISGEVKKWVKMFGIGKKKKKKEEEEKKNGWVRVEQSISAARACINLQLQMCLFTQKKGFYRSQQAVKQLFCVSFVAIWRLVEWQNALAHCLLGNYIFEIVIFYVLLQKTAKRTDSDNKRD